MPKSIQYSFLEPSELIKDETIYLNRMTVKSHTLFPQTNTSQRVKMHQRRYLGCKAGVLDLISYIVRSYIKDFQIFIDIFAGTGVVGAHFNTPSTKIIANDILPSNYTSLSCWLSEENFDLDKVQEVLEYLNTLSSKEENYVSKHFGGKYFSEENARKIGLIREEIECLSLTDKEKAVCLTSLLYAIDKIANTCGHYDGTLPPKTVPLANRVG